MTQSVETLVVGAGPVGLFLACELRRRGRACMLIESAPARSAHSKALAIMPGTLEMLDRAGVASEFLRVANRIDGVRFVMPRRSVFVPFAGLQTQYNFVCILPQWKTQELLEERLNELGGDVCYGHSLERLTQRADGVDAEVQTPSGVRTVRARYVVGCDGVSSTVRAQAGIAFDGISYPGTVLLADTSLRTDVPVNEARVHVHRGGVVTMFPMNESLRRIVVIAPGETLPERATQMRLQERLRVARYAATTVEEIVWSNSFRVHRRVASAMRSANVFLAGDSVHTHSPVGGQGMNIGLHDAWNLASKLSSVLCGTAPESLLDRYERERLAVAKGVLRRTDVLTRALAHPNPLLRITRESIAPCVAGLPVLYGPVLRALAHASP